MRDFTVLMTSATYIILGVGPGSTKSEVSGMNFTQQDGIMRTGAGFDVEGFGYVFRNNYMVHGANACKQVRRHVCCVRPLLPRWHPQRLGDPCVKWPPCLTSGLPRCLHQSYSMNVAINVQRGSNGVFEGNTLICRCQVCQWPVSASARAPISAI